MARLHVMERSHAQAVMDDLHDALGRRLAVSSLAPCPVEFTAALVRHAELRQVHSLPRRPEGPGRPSPGRPGGSRRRRHARAHRADRPHDLPFERLRHRLRGW